MPGAITIGNSLGSYVMVPTATASGTILNPAINAVLGTVTGSVIGAAINSPTTIGATSTPAAPSPSQNTAPSYRNDVWNDLVANMAVSVLLAILFL